MKKSISLVATAGIAIALVFGGASAANAAAPVALPSGQALYAIDCSTNGPLLWTVSPNGDSTPVSAPSGTNECAGGAQVSPVDGLAYFIYYPTSGGDYLATISLTTGVVTTIAPISGATNDAWQLVITNSGDAFISSGNTLYSISLTTGVATSIGSVSPASIGTMGYNPTNDTIYVINYSSTISVFTIDRTTGAGTDTGLTGTWPVSNCLGGGTSNAFPDALVFDSAGYAWIESDSCNSDIMTADLSTGDAVMLGQLRDATGTVYATAPNDFYSETFIIGPAAVAPVAAAPSLAATGFDSTALAISGGVGAVAVLLGAALAITRRKTA
jgi:hypothetical protein